MAEEPIPDIHFMRITATTMNQICKLTDIVTVNQPSPREFASARFPDQSFLHLVFGHLSLDDLQQVYPDCWYEDDTARCLLNILFPRRPSNPYGVV